MFNRQYLLLCAGTLLFTEAILFHWVETKRGMDLKKPGSQADGSFFGITEEFVPKENGYPGTCGHVEWWLLPSMM